MKEYIYNIGYHSYEESEYVQLYHELEFTRNQLRDLIHAATRRVLDKIQSGEIEHPITYTFQNLFDDVIREMIEIYDFEPVEYTAEWECFGWPSVLDKQSWSGSRDKNLDMLTEYLNRNGYTSENMKKYEVE